MHGVSVKIGPKLLIAKCSKCSTEWFTVVYITVDFSVEWENKKALVFLCFFNTEVMVPTKRRIVDVFLKCDVTAQISTSVFYGPASCMHWEEQSNLYACVVRRNTSTILMRISVAVWRQYVQMVRRSTTTVDRVTGVCGISNASVAWWKPLCSLYVRNTSMTNAWKFYRHETESEKKKLSSHVSRLTGDNDDLHHVGYNIFFTRLTHIFPNTSTYF